jgi:hypothetical protein
MAAGYSHVLLQITSSAFFAKLVIFRYNIFTTAVHVVIPWGMTSSLFHPYRLRLSDNCGYVGVKRRFERISTRRPLSDPSAALLMKKVIRKYSNEEWCLLGCYAVWLL